MQKLFSFKETNTTNYFLLRSKYTKCLSTHSHPSFLVTWHAASALWHFLLDTERQRAGWSAQLKQHFWKNCTTFGMKMNCIKMSERETEKGGRERSKLFSTAHSLTERRPLILSIQLSETLNPSAHLNLPGCFWTLNVPHIHIYNYSI